MECAGCQNREVRLTPTISSSFQESGMLWCQAFRPDMGKMYVEPLCSMVICLLGLSVAFLGYPTSHPKVNMSGSTISPCNGFAIFIDPLTFSSNWSHSLTSSSDAAFGSFILNLISKTVPASIIARAFL